MPIKVGFLVGKDTDAVEDPKYELIGDSSFLKDMPDKYRIDPESREYIRNCEEGTKGVAHADVAIPWYIHKHHEDIEVDIIFPEEITAKRLKSNLVNIVVGYDVINGVFESKERVVELTKLFKADNLVPNYECQEFIYLKSKYMQKCIDLGVPMAPTLFAYKASRSPADLLAQIKERGWRTFVMKQSYNAFSLGFMKVTVEECEKNAKILEEYFEEFADCPEYIVQEAIEGFVRNWETRCFWFNGEFQYAIANKAAVSTEDGAERIVTGDDIPEEFLENAKRVGKMALQSMPQLRTPDGQPIDQVLIRTDVGCSDTQVYDKDTNWDPAQKTFFLNEIEYSGTTYFCRHLKFDSVPLWAKLFADKAREINALMEASKAKASEPKAAKRARADATVLKKPAGATKRARTDATPLKKPAAAAAPLMKKPAARK